MKGFACLIVAGALFGCSSTPAQEWGESEGAATSESCSSKVESEATSTKNEDRGRVVSTTATVKASGCLASHDPRAAIERIMDLVMSDASLQGLTAADGSRFFSQYKPSAPKGDVRAPEGWAKSVDVSFNMRFSPNTTMRVHLRKLETGGLRFELRNTSRIGRLGIVAIPPDGLVIQLDASPIQGGVTVKGTTHFVANAGYEDALEGVSDLPKSVIAWLEERVGDTR